MIDVLEKDLTKFATIHTASKAKYYVLINSVQDLDESFEFASEHILDIVVLGKGTNILFTRQEYADKLFIKLGKAFNYVQLKQSIVEIGGAYSFTRAGNQLIELGYKDFVYMSLIPGSLGGGVRQNAGTTNEGEVKDNFLSAKLYDLHERKVVEHNKKDMNFSYRDSVLQEESHRFIVLSAKFLLGDKTNDLDGLKRFVREKKEAKKKKEPLGFRFGSTFKSIQYKEKVWWYIDQVGLRGRKIGGAIFSDKHPNWIINNNDAQADDILTLIEEAKSKVSEKFGINLQVEVDLI